MNYEAARFWLEVFLIIWNIGGSAYLVWERRNRRNDSRIIDLKKEVAEKVNTTELATAKADRDKLCDEHKRRTEAQEKVLRGLHEEIAHLPSRSEIQEHAKEMRTLAKEMGNLEGRISGINRAVDIVNQFLIEQGGKK